VQLGTDLASAIRNIKWYTRWLRDEIARDVKKDKCGSKHWG